MSKGKPSSLTSIAFNTGALLMRERILAEIRKCIHDHECDYGCDNYGCGNGYYEHAIDRIERVTHDL